jgi:hypothetical protein
MQYLKHFDYPFSISTTGVILGFINQLLRMLKHHAYLNGQQKISLILRRCLEVEQYVRITYDSYKKMEATGSFDVDV